MDSELQEITVRVEQIRYASSRTDSPDFRIFLATYDGSLITCVGNAGNISEGDELVLVGSYEQNPKYGREFRVQFSHPVLPHSAGAMAEFLRRNIDGVGKVRAAAITAAFGDGVTDAFNAGPDTIASVPGITKKMAERMCAQFAVFSMSMQEQMFFIELGISSGGAAKLRKMYRERGEDAITAISLNPYRLIDDMPGYGFKRADQAAMKLGIAPCSGYRITAGFRHVLEQTSVQGHTCLSKEELFRETHALLSLDETSDFSPNLEAECGGDGNLVDTGALFGQEYVYLQRLWKAESGAAECLKRCCGNRFPAAGREELCSGIRDIEKKLERTLDDSQREAVIRAVTNGVSIITGGPGTGKTTTISVILAYMEDIQHRDIMLAAPTGRAAKRITEQTGRPAYTIHRMCSMFKELRDTGSCYAGNGQPDRECMPDTVIVDESSMIDIPIMAMLLSALKKGTRLLFVGDVDQLPSVGPGTVLRDMIRSGIIPVSRLTTIHRQKEGSRIVENAHRINRGEPLFNEQFENAEDFYLVRRSAGSQERTAEDIIRSIKEGIPKHFGISPKDIQVLAPMRKGPLGVNALNSMLQEALNGPDPRKKEYRYSVNGEQRVLREGDKVIQTKNDYRLPASLDGHSSDGVFNGEGGMVRKIVQSDAEGLDLLVELDDGRIASYDEESVEELQLAYALTVHKSQGSEYKGVILPVLTGGPPLLYTRNLLYTAVTRAKGMIMLFGDPEVLNRMVRNRNSSARNGHLKELLQMP